MGSVEKVTGSPLEASESGTESKAVDRYLTEGEVDLSRGHQLERGLKSRHIQFLALGGA
jgi:yeast amino acid transporter